MSKLGMPYMGSKRKLSKKIIRYIARKNPNAEYFYDLFGGGGAVSFQALKTKQFKEVHYNELNTGVVEILKDIKENGVTEKYYQWIDRETFNKHKDDNDWLGGLCKVVWSFGNNQKDYLFGKDKEEGKRLLHEIVVNRCEKSLDAFNKKHGLSIKLFDNETLNERRLRVTRVVNIGARSREGELQRLQQLEQLQRLQQLQQLHRLKITNKSYNDVDILTDPSKTVIYLDPPYEGTAGYQKSISHEKLRKWIKSQPFKVYVSSYKFDGLSACMSLTHRSILAQTANNKVSEKLFVWDGNDS